MTPAEILRDADIVPCRPWPRHVLPPAAWAGFMRAVPDSPLTLLAHWADTQQVHALFLDPVALCAVAVSTPVEAARYPAVSPAVPAAAPFERMIADLWGHVAEGGLDQRPLDQRPLDQRPLDQRPLDRRPWLDHGQWPLALPMAPRPEPPRVFEAPEAPFEPNRPLMHLGLGPVHGRLEEAVRLDLLVRDGAIAAAEVRLGFTHKGTLTLMRGKSPRTAARFAARLSGDATVAHALAFASAAEAALSVEPPPRAAVLRQVMLEIERIGVHLDTLSEVARLAGAPAVRTRCGLLREHLLRATAHAFGHRLMMDCVVPGGIALDIADTGAEAILRALGEVASALPGLRRLHDKTVLAARLTGLGRVGLPLLNACGVGGPVGRAAGRRFDARVIAADPPFPVRSGRRDDALGRQDLRMDEIAASLRHIGSALRALPPGPLTVALPQDSGEGIGWAESARGDVWHWLRLDHGQIAACFPRDPGWALWPAAEAVLLNASVEDTALIRASLALPASGMDL